MPEHILEAVENGDNSAIAALVVEYNRLRQWCSVCLGATVAEWDGTRVDG